MNTFHSEATTPDYPNPYVVNPYAPPPPPKRYWTHMLLIALLVVLLGGGVLSAVYLPRYLASSPTSTPTPQSKLAAPIQVSPADGSIFNNYPRTTTVMWQSIPGYTNYVNITYTVDIEFWSQCNLLFAGCTPSWVTMETVSNLDAGTTAYTFDFVGKQQGRWRVWAVDSNGVPGLKSSWWTFTYTV